MKNLGKLWSAIVLAMLVALPCWAADFTQCVNPMIGSGGHGHVFVGANVPFGYVQLGPTEPTRGWDWCSGYHYSDSVLVGFSHQHLSGTGIGELGDITFLPVSQVGQRWTLFTHADELVKPGYYSLRLKQPDVLIELTATQRAGFQRYTYPAYTQTGMFLLNLKQGIGWDQMSECKVKQESATAISGYRLSSGWAKRQYDYFYAEFSKPVKLIENTDSIAYFSFENDGAPLLIKTGLSAVSAENAHANLQAEIPGWDFNGVVRAADAAWNAELGKINITTTDDTVRHIFYTALYHSMIAPSVFSDVNGDYRGADGKVHRGNWVNYTTFSLWDTYRAAHPLMTLIHPEKQADIASTMMHIYQEQGKLPVWHLMGNETDCMVGNPGIVVLADLYLKGYVSEQDKPLAYEALKASAMCDDRGLAQLKEYGYIPYDKDPTFETVAKGLEYALADACVAMVAKQRGNKADYSYFLKRSKAYSKYFDPKTRFMRGLGSDGKFREPFDPFNAIHRQDDYTEGNAWQYTWLVPHDVKGLVALFGGEKPFIQKFDSLFVVTGDLGAEASPDIAGLIGQYAHGNEPSHHVLYMYNYVGQPWKGAKLLRQTMQELYKDDLDGLSGNEDVGQMSSWYILSAMGLYQVEPAGGKYIIGSPIVDKAEINVGNGKTFTVVATNNSRDNIYVQSATLNGKKYTKSYINFADISKGGTLQLVMGPTPSKFGTASKDRP